jgi:hypothetical protein
VVDHASNLDLVAAPLRKLVETHRSTCTVVTPEASGLVTAGEPRCEGHPDYAMFACEQQCQGLLQRAKMLKEQYPKDLFLYAS